MKLSLIIMHQLFFQDQTWSLNAGGQATSQVCSSLYPSVENFAKEAALVASVLTNGDIV